MAPPTTEQQQQAATSAFLAAMQHSHQQLQQQQQQQQQQQHTTGSNTTDAASLVHQHPYHLPSSFAHQPSQQSQLKRENNHDLDDDDDDDDDDGSGGARGSGGVSAGTSGSLTSAKPPPRKAARKSEGSASKVTGAAASSAPGSHSAGDNPPGPPYVCPACKTTYSRLEYLRRHERRHQDIRPFVCECGKGFSRSDVLSRHKKQCHYHLTGEQPSAEAAEAASKKTRKPSTATTSRSRKASSSGGPGGQGDSQHDSADSYSPPSGQPYQQQDNNFAGGSNQSGQTSLLPQGSGASGSMGLPPPPPFYSQQASNAAAAAAAAAAVAAGHGGGQSSQGGNAAASSNDGNPSSSSNSGTDFSRANGFMSAIHHALNTFGHHPPHSNYPPSPESNVSSRNSSPRLHYRDALPYTHRSGSTGGAPGSRQSSLRKGTLDPYHVPVPWGSDGQDGRSSPAPGSSASRPASIFGKEGGTAAAARGAFSSGPTGAGVGSAVGLPGFTASSSSSGAPNFSYPANEFAAAPPTSASVSQSQTLAPAGGDGQNSTAGGQQPQQGQQPSSHPHSRSDPPRFAVSTGPLSPFSGMGLASSTSPYLSAFSNARDTPLVASPGRGVAPGTPTSSLNNNVFDFTMRPPPKPASTSAPSGKNGSTSAIDLKSSLQGGAGGSSSNTIAHSALKNKGPVSITSPQASNDPSTPSASAAAGDGESVPALADFIDDQQRSAANGLLTLLGGGGAETPSRYVRNDAGRPNGGAESGDVGSEASNLPSAPTSSSQSGEQDRTAFKSSDNDMNSNPGTNSAKPSSNPFFESAVTPGPEAFFLRLQGGEQDTRAGLPSTTSIGGSTSIGGHYNHLPSAVVNGLLRGESGGGGGGGGGHHHQPSSEAVGGNGMETPNYGMGSGGWGDFGMSSGSGANVGWLLSPSIQALVSSFATGVTPSVGGDGGVTSGAGGGGGGGYFALSRQQIPSAMGTTPSLKPIRALSSKADGISHIDANPRSTNGDSAAFLGAHAELENLSVIDVGNIALERAFDDIKNPFYLPKSMFKTCYSVPHWQLPSRARLSMLAMHSQQNLCKHAPIQHEPTFRLDSTPGCLAFAICMLGCHEIGRRWFGGLEVVPLEKAVKDAESDIRIEDGRRDTPCDEEDNQELVKPAVMTEKMDMLMRSFPSRCTNLKDKVSVVQALLFFQTSNFLNSDATTRAIASISHSSIVSLARKAGFFDPNAEHVSATIDYSADVALQRLLVDNNDLAFAFSFLPSYLPSCSDEEKIWRLWCEYEGRRRTAYLFFLLDTVASLDAGSPTVVSVDELRHLPLPAPDSVWRASDSKSFRLALDSYKGPTFDEAMKDLLGKSEEGEDFEDGKKVNGEVVAPSQSAKCSSSSILAGQHGPFARLVAILPILRGIVYLLQDSTDKPSPVAKWLEDLTAGVSADECDANSAVRIEAAAQADEEHVEAQVETFKRALSRWRLGWDQDPLCLQASSPVAQAKAEAARKAEQLASLSVAGAGAAKRGGQGGASVKLELDEGTSSENQEGSALPAIFTSKTASGATPLCEDALPFYWLSHVLLGHATSKQVSTTSSPSHGAVNGRGRKRDKSSSSVTSSTASDSSSPVEHNQARGSTSEHGNSNGDGPSHNRSHSHSHARSMSRGSGSGTGRRVPDFRSMLRFAKTFVKSGEGVNGTTSGGELSFTSAAAAATADGTGAERDLDHHSGFETPG